jgi:hypothetical protein
MAKVAKRAPAGSGEAAAGGGGTMLAELGELLLWSFTEMAA